MNILGNKVDRINDFIYHLDHARSVDSWFQNPYWSKNTQLWNQIRQLNKENMIEYYSSLDYVKRRNYAAFNHLGTLGRLANQMFQYASLRGIS